jgi:hypothetical protein
MAKKPKPSLKLIGSDGTSTGTQPPRNIGPYGRKLWDQVMREYAVEDAGGIEMLAQACEERRRLMQSAPVVAAPFQCPLIARIWIVLSVLCMAKSIALYCSRCSAATGSGFCIALGAFC